MLNIDKIRQDFPIFKKHPELVYLDSAATSLKPQAVIDKLVEYYSEYSANIKRGIYKISEKATEEYEATRNCVAEFIGANRDEVIFVRNTTEATNLLSYTLDVGREGEIATTVMEHHSNFIPWQQLAFGAGLDFKVIDVTDDGELNIYRHSGKRERIQNRSWTSQDDIDLSQVISKKTKIFALTYVSNVLGTINQVRKITEAAKKINPDIIVVVDAAQAVPHMKIDVRDLGADFVAFSGHKMLGPTGVGVLWGRRELLERIPPFMFGGEMIEEVRIEETTFAKLPEKFEAGTPAIADVIALKESIKYLTAFGLDNIHEHEVALIKHTIDRLRTEFNDQVTVYGPSERAGIVSFNLKGVHAHDMAAILDEQNICVRAGHHCTMPLHNRLGVSSTARASFYLYNNKQDVDKLIQGLKKVYNTFNK